MTYHPLEILHNYRLGSRQATTELQRSDQPALQIEFDVLKLVEDLKKQPEAVILTGTAGDGKTYLAYKIIEALGLDLNKVRDGQAKGDYQLGKAFIDLDLSARPLDDNRVVEIGSALEKPDQLTLLCANEGKLMQLREKLAELGSEILDKALIVNLSRRALLAPQAWQKILKGTLEGPVWEQGFELSPTSILTRNRALLQDPEVAERLRYYLLLPYLLGEPITVRETLSFLSYALCGGLELEEGDGSELTEKPISDPLSHLLFNNIFSEPGDYRHGGRAVPGEKLLWWLYRFDPADQASPDADLQLLTKLDSLGVEPPPELKYMWHNELVYKDDDDVLYRHRLERYMRYARRWYSLSSKAGFAAYFPFRHFQSYMQALNASASDLQEQVYTLLKGLNLLLSEGQVNDDDLRVFYLLTDGSRQGLTLFNPEFMIPGDKFTLEPDGGLEIEAEKRGDSYLEHFPRRLYLRYNLKPEIRLPISLLLYEVLQSAANSAGSFPATLWAKERDTVVRFMNHLNQLPVPSPNLLRFTILGSRSQTNQNPKFTFIYRKINNKQTFKVSGD